MRAVGCIFYYEQIGPMLWDLLKKGILPVHTGGLSAWLIVS